MAETLEERKERIRHELQEQCPWGDPEEGEIWWREQAVEREAALELAKEALQEISEPIPFMRKRAEAEGGKINGQMAVVLSDDANFLKSIAREALILINKN